MLSLLFALLSTQSKHKLCQYMQVATTERRCLDKYYQEISGSQYGTPSKEFALKTKGSEPISRSPSTTHQHP
jgi:hypothetical protein